MQKYHTWPSCYGKISCGSVIILAVITVLVSMTLLPSANGHGRCTAWRLGPGWIMLHRKPGPSVGIIGTIEFRMHWSALEHTRCRKLGDIRRHSTTSTHYDRRRANIYQSCAAPPAVPRTLPPLRPTQQPQHDPGVSVSPMMSLHSTSAQARLSNAGALRSS